MARKALSDFEGQLNRRDARGWGAGVERNSIAADSDMMLNNERLRTEMVYEPSAQEKKAIKQARRGGMNLDKQMPTPGRYTERPTSVTEHVKRTMGNQVHKTVYRAFDEE